MSSKLAGEVKGYGVHFDSAAVQSFLPHYGTERKGFDKIGSILVYHEYTNIIENQTVT